MLLRRGCLLFISPLLLAASSPARSEPPEEKKPPRVDLYGDPLPEGALARLGSARWRHDEGVAAVVFSPDGKMLASASNDGIIRLCELATGKEIRQFGERYS